MNIDSTMKELAQYTRIMEEATATVDGLKDEIKRYMEETGTELLTGTEHKATYKAVTSSRIDTAALKKDMPDIAAHYTKQTQTRLFIKTEVLKMFELLKERFLKERQNKKQESKFYIENGFCQSWNDEYKTASNEGLKRYSTETRYNQYENGVITREKAVDYAVARMEKQIDKEIAATLEKLERIEKAPDLQYISINVSYTKNATWGYNPTATVNTNTGETTGYASGYGYDKESAAVADAFNKSDAVLKVLYTIKENGLKAGLSDASATACTGVDNRNICGYGSGHDVFPHFEGGVGVGCFWDILKKAGFATCCNYGKHENLYRIYKEE